MGELNGRPYPTAGATVCEVSKELLYDMDRISVKQIRVRLWRRYGGIGFGITS